MVAPNKREALTHWLSPELKLEFRTMNMAKRFDEICKGSEEESWDTFCWTIEKEGRKLRVVGGRSALGEAKKTASSRKSIGSLCDENDDECYICSDGGGKNKN